MRYRMVFAVWLSVFLTLGCSQAKKADQATQEVVDYGTGKTQVESYQGLQKQIKGIAKEEARQFDETTR